MLGALEVSLRLHGDCVEGCMEMALAQFVSRYTLFSFLIRIESLLVVSGCFAVSNLSVWLICRL